MKHLELATFPDAQTLARAAAREWLDEVAAANRSGRPCFTALAGGRITLGFFEAVVGMVKTGGISLAQVHFFWSDERCVPPTHPESSFAAADRLFLKPLGIAAEQIHRIPGEQPPETAAAFATAEVRRIVPLDAAGLPVLDLVFIGMGEDGHVASLFPGEPAAAMKDPAIFRVITNSPKPPPVRVTMGYATISAARQVWVLASGAGKEAALRESLRADGRTPLARVLRSRRGSRVFTDIPMAPATAD